MAVMIKNKLGDALLFCWEAMGIIIDNFITGIAESANAVNNNIIQEELRKISARHMPFFDKIDEMKKAVSEIGGPEDHELRERLLNELDEIAKKGYEVKQGMEEVRNAFAVSGLSDCDKKRIEAEIKRCEETLSNLYSITIPAYTYKNFMAMVRMEGAQHDITVMELSNGQYVAFYPAQHKNLMENAIELATLSDQRHPSVSAVERSAYYGASDKSKAAVLRFENVSAELAEKAVQEANHCSFVNFAKEIIPGTEPQLFNLVCEAGETQEDRNRNYRAAVEILAKSAIAVSGPMKELEEKKMRFDAKRHERLVDGLDSGSGYIFTVRDTAKDSIFAPTEFIRFTTDPKNGKGEFFINVNGITTTTLFESETDRYKDQLYHMSQAGSGAHTYISDEEMKSMQETAYKLYDMVQEYQTPRYSIDFETMSINKSHEAAELRGQGQKTLARSVSEEAKEFSALARACHLAKCPSDKLTKKQILDGIISERLSREKFQARVSQDVAKNHVAIQKMVNWCIRDVRQDAAKDIQNRLRSESKNGRDDFSIPSIKIIQEMDRFNLDRFIKSEYDRAKATEDEKTNENDICIAEVQKEYEMLKEYYPQTLEAAKELISDVRVRMVTAEVSMEAKDIDSTFTISNAKQERLLLTAIELGKNVDELKKKKEEKEPERTKEKEERIR